MIRLECTTGGSNKFYEINCESVNVRHYRTTAYYGAIGKAPKESILYDGDSYQDARQAEKNKVHEKIAKGYREVGNPLLTDNGGSMEKGDAAAGWTGPGLRVGETKTFSGDQIKFMLPNYPVNDVPIIWAMNAQGVKDDKHFNTLMADDNYIAQEKLDGMRAVVHVVDGGLRIFSRSAGVADPTRPLEKTQSLPHLAKLQFPSLVGSVFDCEILAEGVDCANISGAVHTKDGGRSAKDVKIYVFDMLMHKGKDMMSWPLTYRLEHLSIAKDLFRHNSIIHVPWVTGEYKRSLYDEILNRSGEGVMLKNLNATYQQGGRPSKNWYKKKKAATWDCVIMGFTKGEGKYSNQIGAVRFGQYVNGELVEMGQTSGMTNADRDIITRHPESFLGRACVIKGMERLKSGAIRHPQWGGMNLSKKPTDCVWYEGEQ